MAKWHYFGSGGEAYAACGHKPITGFPMTWPRMPRRSESLLCPKCVELYTIHQRELGEEPPPPRLAANTLATPPVARPSAWAKIDSSYGRFWRRLGKLIQSIREGFS